MFPVTKAGYSVTYKDTINEGVYYIIDQTKRSLGHYYHFKPDDQ